MSRLLWYPGHELLLADIVRAENCRVWDSAGRSYVDLESGVWCTSIGHGHPRVLRVLAEASATIAHAGFNYSCPITEEAAREILALAGLEGGRCVFLCSGSEAIEYAVRAVQSIAERPLLLTMTDSYFGAYGSAHAKREGEWHSFDWAPCASCGEAGDCAERCARWETIPFDRIGGFLFEPGSSSGLVRFPPAKLIREIVREVRSAGGFVIVNEVTTGIGRTGAWFGHQHYGFVPDAIAIGKGIGNGYPVSVSALGPRLIDRLGGKPVPYAQSHQNDPLGAAVAREVVRVIRDERLIEKSEALSAELVAGLERIRARSPRIGDVRARGLMAAVEFANDEEGAFAGGIHRTLVERGFLAGKRPGVPVLRLDPALTIERADIDGFLAAFESVLAAAP